MMKVDDTIKEFSCDICQSDYSGQFYDTVQGIDGKEYTLVKCDNCGMIIVFPRPTDEFLYAFYSKKYKGKVKQGIAKGDNLKANLAPIEDGFTKLRYIEKYADVKHRKLLDVGCGHGFFLYAAKEKGYNVQGIDVDIEAIKYGQSVLGLEILEHNIAQLDVFSKCSFDVITFWQVLEHLKMPGTCVRKASTLLRGGGIIAGSVPNIGGIGSKLQGSMWYLMIPPEHISYFNKMSLKMMLINAGFDPLFIGTIPIYASPYFSFGIRSMIMSYSDKSKSRLVKKIFLQIHRRLTLTKRYLIYKPLNSLVMLLNLEGNSLFFLARKI